MTARPLEKGLVSYDRRMSPHDWLASLPAALRREVGLLHLIEPGPDLDSVVAGLESAHRVSIAMYDLARPEPERSEAHPCQRVQPAVLTGGASERIRAAETNAAEPAALIAYPHPLQMQTVGRP